MEAKEKHRLVDVSLVKGFRERLQSRQDTRLALAQAAKLKGDIITTTIMVALANEAGNDMYELKQLIGGAK